MRFIRRALIVFALLVLFSSEFALAQINTINQVPNPGFVGKDGALFGDASGTVPLNWRAFAVGGGELSIKTVPLAANTLYGRSPATNAVQLTVGAFGADQDFDHEVAVKVADLGFRLNNDGGDNSILIAMPTVEGPADTGAELTYPPVYTPGRNFAAANGVTPPFVDEITHPFSNTEHFTFKDYQGIRSARFRWC